MPELPEVETIIREIAPRIVGRTIRRVRVHRPDVLRAVSPDRLRRAVTGRSIRAVSRRAKHAVLELDSGRRLVVQPRMTGSLIVQRHAPEGPEQQYVVLVAQLDGDTWLLYRDVRRLGTIWLLTGVQWNAYSARVGPEPLDRAFTPAALFECLSGTRQAVKKALMDQRRLAGVGNIYANEALFRAGVDPSRPANQLTQGQVTRLHRAILEVLREAIAARGTTVRDYRTGTGGRGAFQHVLRVYGRGGGPCVQCGRRLVTTHAIDGRATTFCITCQGQPGRRGDGR